MPVCSIVADHKSEERYAKLSLVHSTSDEREIIQNAIENSISLVSLQANICEGALSDGRRVISIEYHDDCDRESGKVFEAIINYLGIEECH